MGASMNCISRGLAMWHGVATMMVKKLWIHVVVLVLMVTYVFYWRAINFPHHRVHKEVKHVRNVQNEANVQSSRNVTNEVTIQPTRDVQNEVIVQLSRDVQNNVTIKSSDKKEQRTMVSVNVVPSSPSSPLPYKDCIRLPKCPREGTKICIYPVDQDTWISGALKQGKLWEGGLVKQMLEAMKTETDIQLVDFGANIGVYTLSASAAGYDVMAVEMLPTNVHMLQTSLQESGLSDRVTLVNNAVYDDHRTMGVKSYRGNVGGTALDLNNSTTQVNAVWMDDLVGLVKHKKVYVKMDIELAEIKALRRAHNFFKQLDVRVLHMEFVSKTSEEIEFARTFFSEKGMKASSSALQYKPCDIKHEHRDLFFIRM